MAKRIPKLKEPATEAALPAHSGPAIERVPIASVHPDPQNVRKHAQKNLDAIKSSLARFGQQKPLVVDGDSIVRAGNGTLQAAIALGWETILIVRTALRGNEAKAFAIADNRTGELAEWDVDALQAQLAELETSGIANLVLGFTSEDLAAQLDAIPDEIEQRAEDQVKLKPIKVRHPPRMAWVLIGIPTVRFGEISAMVDRVSAIAGTTVETTVNDGE